MIVPAVPSMVDKLTSKINATEQFGFSLEQFRLTHTSTVPTSSGTVKAVSFRPIVTSENIPKI